MKSLICMILWLLFQQFVEINCQMTPFKNERNSHSSTLIDNKLYILDGRRNGSMNNIIRKGFFYLDVSSPFNTEELPWHDLSSIDNVPSHYGAASVKGGAGNDTLFLYGGSMTDNTVALVYTYNPQSNSWSIPKITGNNTVRKYDFTGIIDRNGKMYLWGGVEIISGKDLNDMFILDTVNFRWEPAGSLINVPTPREVYGAVLLPENNIIYMGKQVILVIII